MRRLVWWIAPIYSAAVSAWLLLVPTFATASSTARLVEGQTRPALTSMQVSTSLFDVEGWWVLIALALPVALAAAPLARRTPFARRRLAMVSSVLLFAFSSLASFSIGYFYLPAAAALLAAALLADRPVGTAESGPAV